MNKLPPDIKECVQRALAEDLGSGDRTAALIPQAAQVQARVISRERAIICGRAWFDEVFAQLDARVTLSWEIQDGDSVQAGQTLCTLRGPARAVLSGERTALNFLQTLSGTATTTRAYVDAVRGTAAVILDTRKTLPGLRRAQKYAVTCGGGQNHRMGLYDAILIKENHIRTSGSISAVLAAARAAGGEHVPLEIEVENLEQLHAALAAGAQRLLLDNFDLAGLRSAVAVTAGRARLEASGGVTLANLRAIAETGVDYISMGSLTKNVQAIDLSLGFE